MEIRNKGTNKKKMKIKGICGCVVRIKKTRNTNYFVNQTDLIYE